MANTPTVIKTFATPYPPPSEKIDQAAYMFRSFLNRCKIGLILDEKQNDETFCNEKQKMHAFYAHEMRCFIRLHLHV